MVGRLCGAEAGTKLASGNYIAQYVKDHRDALAKGVYLDKTTLPAIRPTISFDIIPHIADVTPLPERQFFVIADRRDRLVPFFLSELLVNELTAKGHRATLVEALARGPNFMR